MDAFWLSPIYPSPLADFGYDVSDYTGVDPVFGTLADFDALTEEAHSRGLRVLMDLVPCHTSIEHPWFREHPDWYIWADGRDGRPPNNWLAAFGGSAWTFDERRGRWYLHSFYPEQPDLDWRNPEVVAAMGDVIRFWLERGADGYRVDAIDRLVKDAQLRDDPPASAPFGLPVPDDQAHLDFRHSRNDPDTGVALAEIRAAAGDAFLVGEVYFPARHVAPYLEHLDRFFAFELFHAAWDATAMRAAIADSLAAATREGTGPAWVMSNHDFGRLATRFGRARERAAALLLLTLPGTAFLYQGDEIGLGDGPGADPPFDRHGRDGFRHPMQWDPSPTGGFTTGRPWLPPVDPGGRNVAAERDEPGSLLTHWRELIALRRELPPEFEWLKAPEGVLAYARGERSVCVNMTREAVRVPRLGEIAPDAGAIF
ncbi:MAG: alpha-amylase family glycosyl hydrolase [Actinomycetota bacterium]|nr:alpha-amylase family glycosyl hydrolase [Actinomycetota bacterium]